MKMLGPQGIIKVLGEQELVWLIDPGQRKVNELAPEVEEESSFPTTTHFIPRVTPESKGTSRVSRFGKTSQNALSSLRSIVNRTRPLRASLNRDGPNKYGLHHFDQNAEPDTTVNRHGTRSWLLNISFISINQVSRELLL
jgi:hypothetical protein